MLPQTAYVFSLLLWYVKFLIWKRSTSSRAASRFSTSLFVSATKNSFRHSHTAETPEEIIGGNTELRIECVSADGFVSFAEFTLGLVLTFRTLSASLTLIKIMHIHKRISTRLVYTIIRSNPIRSRRCHLDTQHCALVALLCSQNNRM